MLFRSCPAHPQGAPCPREALTPPSLLLPHFFMGALSVPGVGAVCPRSGAPQRWGLGGVPVLWGGLSTPFLPPPLSLSAAANPIPGLGCAGGWGCLLCCPHTMAEPGLPVTLMSPYHPCPLTGLLVSPNPRGSPGHPHSPTLAPPAQPIPAPAPLQARVGTEAVSHPGDALLLSIPHWVGVPQPGSQQHFFNSTSLCIPPLKPPPSSSCLQPHRPP